MSFLSRVQRTLRERALLRGRSKVLVACSGGADSQALLHALVTLSPQHGCTLCAVSIDHGLRPDAAADVELARALAEQLGVPFAAKSVTVPAGASLQAQARNARYALLQAHAREQSADAIAVGHTRDDQAETVLARLLRGASLEGLSAIAPRRADGVVRPLIDATRAEVEDYVRQCGLVCAQDPSNRDRRFLRVRLRHELLPVLRRENPLLDEGLARLADDAREAAELVADRIAHLSGEGPGLPRLRDETSYVRRRWLAGWARKSVTHTGLTRRHLDGLERMVLTGAGEVRLPGGRVVSVSADQQLVIRENVKRGRGDPRRN